MSDEEQIREGLRTYFECMYESSAAKTHAAFHPNARISGYLKNRLVDLSVEEFADFVASQQPSPEAQNKVLHTEIVSLDVAGNTAIARVRDDYLGNTFLDTLSYLNIEGRWAIQNKLFHAEN